MAETWIDLKEGLALKKEELADANPEVSPESPEEAVAPSKDEPAQESAAGPSDVAAEAPSEDEAPKGKLSRSARLKAQRDRERQRASELEAKLHEVYGALQTLQQQRQQENYRAAEAYERQLDTTKDAIVNELKRAKTEGDVAAEVAAEEKLAQLISQRQSIGAWKSQQQRQPQPQQQPQFAPQSPPPPAEAALAWAEDNKWFTQPSSAEDKKRARIALAINASLIEEGYDPNDDEFYSKLDEELVAAGAKKAAAKPNGGTASRPNQASPVAPSPRGPSNPGRVRLDEGQLRMGQRLGVKPVDYAKASVLPKNEHGYDLINLE